MIKLINSKVIHLKMPELKKSDSKKGKHERRIRSAQKILDIKSKSPGIAAFLSLIIVGSGFIYLGRIGTFLAYIIITFILALAVSEPTMVGIIMSIIAAIHSYSAANTQNELLKAELELKLK